MQQTGIVFFLLALCAAACVSNALTTLHFSEGAYRLLNTVLPLAITLGFGLMAIARVAAAPVLIWTPAVMFFVNMAVFAGVGPLVYVFGSEVTQAKIWSGAWALSPKELLATHALTLTGASAVMVGLWAGGFGAAKQPARAPRAWSAHSVPAAALVLFGIGAIVRYGLLAPASFGGLELQIPGFVRNLRFLLDLGLALFAYLAVRRRGSWILLFWACFPPHLFFQLLEFKKSALAIALMLPVLGAFLANGKLRGLIAGGLLIGALVVALHPLVKQARAEMIALSGETFGASYTERVDILKALAAGTLAGTGPQAAGPQPQVGWIRLAYSAPQAIAMRSYDQGLARDTVSTAWQVIVPRALWPEKPDFTSLSAEFYTAITGGSGTLTGATVFADSYWNFGWPGVLAIGFVAGLFFAAMSRFAVAVVQARDFVLLPAVFLAMDMALRGMNGWVLTGLAGPLPVLLAYLLLVKALRGLGRAEAPA